MQNRKVIRLQNNDYSHPGEYFITICVKERLCLLGEIIDEKMCLSSLGEITQKWITKLPEKYQNIEINHSVIMPDHIHFIVEIIEYRKPAVGAIHELPLHELSLYEHPLHEFQDAYSRRKMLLAKVIGYFKMNSAKEINVKLTKSNHAFWQRNYHDHIIRNKDEYYAMVNYMKNNPSNWKTPSP